MKKAMLLCMKAGRYSYKSRKSHTMAFLTIACVLWRCDNRDLVNYCKYRTILIQKAGDFMAKNMKTIRMIKKSSAGMRKLIRIIDVLLYILRVNLYLQNSVRQWRRNSVIQFSRRTTQQRAIPSLSLVVMCRVCNACKRTNCIRSQAFVFDKLIEIDRYHSHCRPASTRLGLWNVCVASIPPYYCAFCVHNDDDEWLPKHNIPSTHASSHLPLPNTHNHTITLSFGALTQKPRAADTKLYTDHEALLFAMHFVYELRRESMLGRRVGQTCCIVTETESCINVWHMYALSSYFCKQIACGFSYNHERRPFMPKR